MGIYDYLGAYTAPALLNLALNQVTANVDRREGSVIFDTLSPLSIVAADIIAMMRSALSNTDLQSATGEWLDLIGQQPPCGVYRKQATFAQKYAIATPIDAPLTIGLRFQSNAGLGLFWAISEVLGDGRYILTCETAGAAPGGDYGTLTPVVSNSELKVFAFEDVAPFNAGNDEESDYDFRLRIWDALKTDAYGGNFADYKHWVLSDIGTRAGEPSFDGMQFFPSSRYIGGGNIMIRPTQPDQSGHAYCPADPAACDALKAYLDPEGGSGAGVSPVGHRVSVAAPKADVWNLTIYVTLKSGYTLEDYISPARAQIEKYFEAVRRSLVSTINDAFPTASGASAGYLETLFISTLKGYLVPEISAFSAIGAVTRDGAPAVDVIYDPTAANASLPVLGTVSFEEAQ